MKKERTTTCDQCNRKIEGDAQHKYHALVLCEDCFLETKMTRKRKTHWQYLTSIKMEYLKPGPPEDGERGKENNQ
jgi:hypothetical protein